MRQVTQWEPTDLLVWRRKRGTNQVDLAKALGIHVNTLIRWERGRHPLPDDIGVRLEAIAAAADASGKPPVSLKISFETRHHWPHLQLYTGNSAATMALGPDHPRILIDDWGDLNQTPGALPAEILESQIYLSERLRKRGK